MTLTKSDFDKYLWQRVIAESSEKVCDQYCELFGKEIEAAGDDIAAQGLFDLLRFITSLHLYPENSRERDKNEPFGDNRYGVDRIHEEHLQILEEILTDVDDAELRSRIADIIWIRYPSKHQIAVMAVDSYLQSATELEKTGKWFETYIRIERAVQIAIRQGRDNPPFQNAIAHIERLLDDDKQAANSIYLQLLQILYHYKASDPGKCAKIAEDQACQLQDTNSWFMASRFWELNAQWEQRAGNENGARTGWIAAAEVYIKLSEESVKADPPQYLAASDHLQTAIQLLRKTSDVRERVDELHALLLQYRQKSLESMGRISASTDITEHVREAQKAVKGKPLHEALTILTTISSSPRKGDLRAYVDQIMSSNQLQFAIPKVVLNASGRVISHRSSLLSAEPENIQVAIDNEMYSFAVRYQDIIAQGLILPAVEQIMIEHYITYDDIVWLTGHSPFVPPGREHLFARGLYAGLNGDFMVAAHLLIPQIEHSIRYILAQTGLITTSIDSDGIQKEYNLNTCLEEPRFVAKLTEVFDANIVFDLQGLLIKAAGSNLRNRAAHGLLSSMEFASFRCVYLWWLALRLFFWPILAQMQQIETTEEEPRSEDTD